MRLFSAGVDGEGYLQWSATWQRASANEETEAWSHVWRWYQSLTNGTLNKLGCFWPQTDFFSQATGSNNARTCYTHNSINKFLAPYYAFFSRQNSFDYSSITIRLHHFHRVTNALAILVLRKRREISCTVWLVLWHDALSNCQPLAFCNHLTLQPEALSKLSAIPYAWDDGLWSYQR